MPSFTEQLRNADEQQELHRKTNAQSAPGPGEVSTGSVARPATSFLPFNRDEETEAMGELLSARINLGRAKPTATRVIEMACGHGDDRQLAERGLR